MDDKSGVELNVDSSATQAGLKSDENRELQESNVSRGDENETDSKLKSDAVWARFTALLRHQTSVDIVRLLDILESRCHVLEKPRVELAPCCNDDLAAVVRAWPKLPEHIRKAIVTLVGPIGSNGPFTIS